MVDESTPTCSSLPIALVIPPLERRFAPVVAPAFLLLPSSPLSLRERCNERARDPRGEESVFAGKGGAQSEQGKTETDGAVRRVVWIAPASAPLPPSFPVDACHRGLSGLFYRAPVVLPSSPPFSASSLFSLFLSQDALETCACTCRLFALNMR